MLSRNEARRQALLAAARVALFATAAGCTKDPATAPAAPPSTATSVETGPGGCQLPSSDSPSAQESECCVAGAGSLGPRDPELGPDVRAPASIVVCCTRVIAYRDRMKSSPRYDPCCAVLDKMSGACTPWGPPVPPRMRAV